MHMKSGPGRVTARIRSEADGKSLWSQESSTEKSSSVEDEFSVRNMKHLVERSTMNKNLQTQ